MSRSDRRQWFLQMGCGGLAAAFFARDGVGKCEEPETRWQDAVVRIKDPEIRQGLVAAVSQNLLPAAVEEAYPGHFNISADGRAYGGWATWPGLDSWQMAGAYLLLGRRRLVLDYFDFVRACQRANGDIPFAIFTGDTKPQGSYLNGLRHPDDVVTYRPPAREGLPDTARETRQWIGLFQHWEPQAEPLSTLGATCYILTAAEIVDATGDLAWLAERLLSIEAAGSYLLSRKSPNGLIARSGFYMELPPRDGWDGVAQCYVIHAFRELARLCTLANRAARAEHWQRTADQLRQDFQRQFWQEDHFAEYIHRDRGVVDQHGLSDTNFAAIALRVADVAQRTVMWPKLTAESAFWWGDMPTLPVTRPFSYEPWELDTPRWLDYRLVPLSSLPLSDMACMGRTWYLDALASIEMNDTERLVRSVRLVCAAAKPTGFWRERYTPATNGTVLPDKAEKYCEYPAVLTRLVLGHPQFFC